MTNFEEKIYNAFPTCTVNKTSTAATLMSFLDLDSDLKSWLLQKFTDKDGKLNAYMLSEYVKEYRLPANEWNIRLLEARHSEKGYIKLLTKVVVEFDYANDMICYSLPEYSFPKKKKEAQVDWSTVSKYKKYLLTPDGCWGLVTLIYDCGIVVLDDFEPICPYTYDLNEYREAAKQFTTEEWIDVILSGLNFNPKGFTEEEKLTIIQRFLPFVEKRLNTIELAIKGSAKSYCYSQLSPHNWLVSGNISRASAFYNLTTKKGGYFTKYSQIAFDEVQSIKTNNAEEMSNALKTYLESGEIRVGDFCTTADAGLSLIGNIDINRMDSTKYNMFKSLPKWMGESAFIDRFAMIIDGKKIGRFNESRKMNGWGISTNYLVELFHSLRDEFYYRCIIDELLIPEKGADTRNVEAVKRIATAYLKLLFPYVTSVEDIDVEKFKKYCLEPAIAGRGAVLSQLQIIDEEYEDKKMPEFAISID